MGFPWIGCNNQNKKFHYQHFEFKVKTKDLDEFIEYLKQQEKQEYAKKSLWGKFKYKIKEWFED